MTLCGYDLSIDIGGLDGIGIDDGHPPDPSTYEHLGSHPSDTTEPD